MKICVIGGGASGMIAAIFAARDGVTIDLHERNEKLGKKIYITGKGRCNLLNYSDAKNVLENIVTNSKFMTSSIYSFDAKTAYDFFEEIGLKMKIERGNRVFPQSEKASDVTKVLEAKLKRQGVNIRLNSRVGEVLAREDGLFDVKIIGSDNTEVYDKVVIATGGLSYPTTGSDGDGYKMAKRFGHLITPLVPALVSINLADKSICKCAGLTLKNVSASIVDKNGKKLFEEFGEMLVTHNGFSGPTILSLSSKIAKLAMANKLYISIDLKPALDFAILEQRVLADFKTYLNKDLQNALKDLLPQNLIQIVIDKSGIDGLKKINCITKDERATLVKVLKDLRFEISGLGGFNEAVITSGGVSVDELNPKTFESKKTKGLYFCGEIVDVDAFTGGYNLQIAFSSGHSVGIAISSQICL